MADVPVQTTDAASLLELPDGWVRIASEVYQQPRPDDDILVDAVEFRDISVGGLSLSNLFGQSIGQLQAAASAHGSTIYAMGLIRYTEFDALGLRSDRYRWIVVHHQAPLVLIITALLSALPILLVAYFTVFEPKKLKELLDKVVNPAIQDLEKGVAKPIFEFQAWWLLLATGVAAGSWLLLTEIGARRYGLTPSAPPVPELAPVAPPQFGAGISIPGFTTGAATAGSPSAYVSPQPLRLPRPAPPQIVVQPRPPRPRPLPPPAPPRGGQVRLRPARPVRP